MLHVDTSLNVFIVVSAPSSGTSVSKVLYSCSCTETKPEVIEELVF